MKKHAARFLLCAVLMAGLLLAAPVFAASSGGLTVSGGTEGTDYQWKEDVLTVLTETPLTVHNDFLGQSTQQRIVISKNISANITLSGVNIEAVGAPAVQIEGKKGNVTITLKNENRLVGGFGHAAIEKNGKDSKLTLTGDGCLTARGGKNATAIGSCGDSTYIVINGGVITAEGGDGAAADIGTAGCNTADIRISPTASVKGSFSVRPTGLNRERVSRYVLDHTGSDTVSVNGTKLPYKKHMAENKLFLWLPVGDHTVQGNTITIEPEYGLTVTGGTEGTDYLYYSNELRIITDTPLTVSNTDSGSPTGDMIFIEKDVDADVTLAGVNISNIGALRIADGSRGNVQIRLADGTVNTLQASGGAAVQKSGTNGTLTVSGTGSLDAYGGKYSAGIGGGVTYYDEGSNYGTTGIIIVGGTVTAHGGVKGAGIGSGLCGTVGDLTFAGGTVTAYGEDDSAGIGGGDECQVGSIRITGGSVTAYSGGSSAGIGGGDRGGVGTIRITGGTVNAYGSDGASIGCGYHGSVELIEITGGTVYAVAKRWNAAIGSAQFGYANDIRISGGTVTAVCGGMSSAAIGGAYEGHAGEISITGGNVTAKAESSFYQNTDVLIGSVTADRTKITIRDCILTVDGSIGSVGTADQSVIIDSDATVKVSGILTTPKNDAGEPVYQLRIENADNKNLIFVDSEAFLYSTHNGEKAVYPYRPGRNTEVTVGTDTQLVTFDSNTKSFAATHAPAAQRSGVKAATCTADGYTGDLYCRGCGVLLEQGKTIVAPGHDCTLTVTDAATLYEPGTVSNHCTVCHEDYTTEQRLVGSFIVSGIESDGDVTFSDGVLTVMKNRTLMIQNIYEDPTTARLAVADGVSARIILNGVNIDVSSMPSTAAFSIADGSNGNVRVELAHGSQNVLRSGSSCAGLQKNSGSEGTLTITGSGSLTAVGGTGGAGIGSGAGTGAFNISITGGTITATGGAYGAGIGSGLNFSAENLSITGGVVTATGGSRAYGVGHGFNIISYTKTRNLVIGDAASVKANGGKGKLGTDPLNKDGAAVSLYVCDVPVGASLNIGEESFPYSGHMGEQRVYVYLTESQRPQIEMLYTGSASPESCTASFVKLPAASPDEGVKADFSGTVVDGLNDAALAAGSVAITLTIETDTAPATENIGKIREIAKCTNLEFFDLTLTMQSSEGASNDIGDSNEQLLTIVIPFDFSEVNAGSVTVLRCHGGSAEKLKKNPASGEEGFAIDEAAGKITVCAKKFSTYAIGYDPLIRYEKGSSGRSSAEKPKDTVGTDGGDGPISAFTDMDVNAWYADGVAYCLANGLMNGVADTKFDPAGNITRAMIVTMLWRLDGRKYPNYAMSFKDVPADQWYTEAVRWAQAERIVSGYDDERFGPNDLITREQLSTILYHYAQYKGQGFTGSWMFLLDFADRADIGSWADEAVHWCSMKGVVNGKDGKVFDPQGNATRAEAAAMMQRFCAALEK